MSPFLLSLPPGDPPKRSKRSPRVTVKIFGVQREAAVTTLGKFFVVFSPTLFSTFSLAVENGTILGDLFPLLQKKHVLHLSPRIHYWFTNTQTGFPLTPSDPIPPGRTVVLSLNIRLRLPRNPFHIPDSLTAHTPPSHPIPRSLLAASSTVHPLTTLFSFLLPLFAFHRLVFSFLHTPQVFVVHPLAALFPFLLCLFAFHRLVFFPIPVNHTIQIIICGATRHGRSVMLTVLPSDTVGHVKHLLLTKDVISHKDADSYTLSKASGPPLNSDSTLSDLGGIHNASQLSLRYRILGGARLEPYVEINSPSSKLLEDVYDDYEDRPTTAKKRKLGKPKGKENHASAAAKATKPPATHRVVNNNFPSRKPRAVYRLDDTYVPTPGPSNGDGLFTPWKQTIINVDEAESSDGLFTPRKRKRTTINVDGSESGDEFEPTDHESPSEEESDDNPPTPRQTITNKKITRSKGKGKANQGNPPPPQNQGADQPVTKKAKSVGRTSARNSVSPARTKKSASTACSDGKYVQVFENDDRRWPCRCGCNKSFDQKKTWTKHMSRLNKTKWDTRSWDGSVYDVRPKSAPAACFTTFKNSGDASTSAPADCSSGLIFTRNGSYKCADGRQCKHSSHNDWGAEGDDPDTDFDESCLVLKELGMAVYKRFKLVICKEHHTLHNLESLRKHVESHHKSSLPKQRLVGKFDAFINHVETAFPIEPTKKGQDYPSEISRPIRFLSPPKPFFTCPNCKHAAGSEKDTMMLRQLMSEHFKNPKHGDCAAMPQVKAWTRARERKDSSEMLELEASLFAPRYGQLAALAGTMHPLQWVLFQPVDWVPDGDSQPAGHVEIAETSSGVKGTVGDTCGQEYAQKLGWIAHFGEDISNWKQLLCGGTKKDRTNRDGGDDDDDEEEETEHKPRKAVEYGLSAIKGFLFNYLQGAVDFVGSCNEGFRRELTMEAGNKSTRSMYRDLQPGSLDKYKEALYAPIALALWLVHAEFIEDVPSGVSIGDVMDDSAQDAATELYLFLTRQDLEEDIPEEELGRHTHNLLFEFLTTQRPVEEKVAGPFDYALVLSSYIGPEEGFGPPTKPGGILAQQQFCKRSIVVHLSRLGEKLSNYTPFEAPSEASADEAPSENEPDPTLDPEADPAAALEAVQDEEVTPPAPQIEASWKDSGPSTKKTSKFMERFLRKNSTKGKEVSDPEPEPEPPQLREDKLLTNLSKFHQWISTERQPGRQLTAFQRCKLAWLKIWPRAKVSLGSTNVRSNKNGLNYHYSSPHVDQEIRFNDLRSLLHDIIQSVRIGLDDLLPSALSEKPAIDMEKLKDNLAFTESIIEQNSEMFKPSERGLYDLLKVWSKDRKQKWQGKEKTVLEGFAAAISLTSGLLARGFQMARFQYNSSKTVKRHLFIFNGTVVFGWVRSKSFAKDVQESLWGLPPDLGALLLLYLGVIRPVSILLTVQLDRSPNQFARTHVFVSAPGKKGGNARQAWDGPRIDRVLRSKTESPLGVGLSSGMIRHLITAIFRQHLPHLINNSTRKTTSIANQQGDHNENTSDTYYGNSAGPGIALKLSDGDMKRLIDVSQSWQALQGLIPASPEMQMILLKTPQIELLTGNREVAMLVARQAICTVYNVGGANSAEMAKSLKESQPFLPRVEDESLGDSVLIQTASALVYGLGSPSIRNPCPVLGFSADIITEAVALITLGVWALDKNEVEVSARDLLRQSLDARETLMKYMLPRMTQVRDENSEKWQAVGVKAHDHARAKYASQIGSSELTAFYKP